MAERAASMVREVRFIRYSAKTELGELAFDHFRHSEEILVRIRRIRQRFLMRQRLSQALYDIFAIGVCKALTSLLGPIDSIASRNLRHRRHVCSVEFVEAVDVIQDRI